MDPKRIITILLNIYKLRLSTFIATSTAIKYACVSEIKLNILIDTFYHRFHFEHTFSVEKTKSIHKKKKNMLISGSDRHE